jgi:hypothetical protein
VRLLLVGVQEGMLQEDAVMLQVLQTPSVGEVCRSYINVINYYHVVLEAHKSSYLVKQRDQHL